MPSATTDALAGVPLSFPTLITLAKGDEKSPRSWIQVARTGSFKSRRYGDFSITKSDLSEMLHNFKNITPKEPTELPVDYDHLSMDPKKPGDGIAAGWFKDLALRGEGEELWGEVGWTPDGAEHIRNGEYRFVSPSFVKNHKHKDGSQIGTTLLAAAITNHPFLEGMAALTLYSMSAMGDLALADEVINLPFAEYDDFEDCVSKNGDKDDPKAFCGWLKHKIEGRRSDVKASDARIGLEKVDIVALSTEWEESRKAIHLAEIGQRVMLAPGNARTQDEIGATFEINEVIGDGEDQFVSVKDAAGMIHKWFRATELLPASSTPANPQHPPLNPGAAPVVPAQAMGAAVPGQQGIAPVAPPAPDPMAAAATAAKDAKAKGEDPEKAATDAAVAAKAAGDAAPGAPGAPGAIGATAKVTDKNAPGGKKSDAEDKADEKDNEGATGGEGVAAEEAAAADAAAMAAAAGGVVPGAVPGVPGKASAENLEPGKKKADTAESEDDDVVKAIKKAATAALASGQKTPQRGMLNMKFMLRNDKNEEFEVTAEQLEKAGVKVVPEGAVAVPTSELDGLKGQVTNLSNDLKSEKSLRVKADFDAEIKRLKDGALITGAQESFARKTWGESTDLSAFKEWAATFTTPVMALNKEHGSSGKPDATKTQGEQASEKIIVLSQSIAKERGISLSDATKLAAGQLADEAETYREQFAEV